MYLNLLRYPAPPLLTVPRVRLRRAVAGCLASPGTYGLSRRTVVNKAGYYWAKDREQLLMLLVYSKTEQEELTASQLKILRRVVEEEYR